MTFSLQRKHFIKRLGIFFAILGPGIITANVDNDAGGITTYSLAGANFGYTLLWSLIPIMFSLILIQGMSNRMGVVTGKGFSDLIREKFGVKITFYLMILILITNFGNIISEFAGVASGMEIFGVNKYISVPIASIIVWYVVVKGTYKSVEKIFLIACIFYISYIISGFLAKPAWDKVLVEFIKPDFSFHSDYIIMLVALVGTTIAPWMQFYQQSSVVEKGIKIKDYKYSRLDTIMGTIAVNVIAFFIIVVCAAVLFKETAIEPIKTASDAAKALKPLAGEYCSGLFAFGLLNASLFAASILPLSTAFTICESFGWETGVNKNFAEAPQFYILYSLLIFFGASFILLPRLPLIKIMFFSQVINGIVLPFVILVMIIIVNDKKIMGNYINGKISNIFLIIFLIISFLLSFLTIYFWGQAL